MFSRKSLPVGTLFMVLVIMLALLGVGYAFWFETLTIEGTVETGEVDVEFSWDYQPNPVECVDVHGELICPEPSEKADAANCEIEWLGPDGDGTDDSTDDGYDQLNVTVTGMYPSYHCIVKFDVTSTGSVPVHVRHPVATTENPEWVKADFDTCYSDGEQLHQNESTEVCEIDIHFTNETAPPEASEPITFGWEILVHQWNELPPGWIRADAFNPQNFGPTGWGGQSCPAGYLVVGGGFEPAPGSTGEGDVAAQGMAKPGVTVAGYTYPNYPHHTYTPPEEGWVVQNDNDADESLVVFALCAPAP